MLEAVGALFLFWTIWSLFCKVQKQVDEIEELRKKCEEKENEFSERMDSLKRRMDDE